MPLSVYRMPHALLLACALMCAWPVAAVAAEKNSYTMEEAVNRALEMNPSIGMTEASLQAATAGKRGAAGGFGPSASTSYSFTQYDQPRIYSSNITLPVVGTISMPPNVANDRHNYSWQVMVSQPLFTGFNLLSTYQKAALNEEKQALQLEQARLALTGQVQEAFLGYLAAEQSRLSASRSLERARAQLATAQAAYDLGLRPRLDVLQAELDVSSSEAKLIQAENTISTLRAQLNTLMKLPVENATEFMGDLNLVPFDMTLTQCLERALRQRPDLQMAYKSLAMAEKDVKIAQSSFYPQVSATFVWATQGDTWEAAGTKYRKTPREFSQWQAGITANWALFTSGKRYYGTKQAAAGVRAITYQVEQTTDLAALEVKSRLLASQDAKRLAGVAAVAFDRASLAYENAKLLYELQVGTSLDLLTAQSNLADAETSLINSHVQYLVAISRLYIAMGELHPAL